MSNGQSGGVLVVPRVDFDRLGSFQGFSVAAGYLDALLDPARARFRPRALVEDDPSYKQIIPYVIFRSHHLVFTYTRGASQGESRLHRLRSLGVGGHVEEADAEGRATMEAYELALRRELDEEVEITASGSPRCVGMINDDLTPVGQVHLGVVYLYDLDRPAVKPREHGLAEACFEAIGELGVRRGEFESWSSICIESVLLPRLGQLKGDGLT